MRLNTVLSATLKIASILALSSCGIQVDHDISGKVSLDVDLEKLADYFVPVCMDELPEATEDQIEDCVKSKVGYFLQAVVLESNNND
jgi:hypothetical protein